MIDLFSIVFSTGMVMLIIFRAIRCDSAGDTHDEDGNNFAALNDVSRRTNRNHTR
jgi:hypothetical protein